MKDLSLEEKNRRLEEVKLKYHAANVEPDIDDVQAAHDLLGVFASSFSQKPTVWTCDVCGRDFPTAGEAKEHEGCRNMVKAVEETSFKDRMAACEKNVAEFKAMGDAKRPPSE